jgi:FkbM family methyltransferase
MRLSLLYNPLVIIDRLAVAINRNNRKRKLRNTPASKLGIGYLSSLELLELIKADGYDGKTIYDIGANIGTWTLLAKAFFPESTIHAFEPLSNHLTQFNEKTKELKNINIHTFCLGSENTESIINVSSFSDSSSLLDSAPLEFEEFGIQKINEEKVQVKRLDTVIESGLAIAPDIVKIDVQGFELEVLKGMGDYLNSTTYLIIEVSFKEYYLGQPLFLEIANYLAGFDFKIYALGHSTPIGIELGQTDVLFKKQK